VKLPVSSALVSVHCHATEDEDKVLKALHAVIPTGVKVERTGLEGHHGNPIIALTARITDREKLTEIWDRIVGSCGRAIALQVDERTDDLCNLHLRFDKQKAFEGALVLTNGGDSIYLKLKIRTFPSKRENAIKLVKELLVGG